MSGLRLSNVGRYNVLREVSECSTKLKTSRPKICRQADMGLPAVGHVR
jgi:hypothetical protein